MNETILKIIEMLKESGMNYRVLCEDNGTYTISVREKTE